MKRIKSIFDSCEGFTLIEIIITIIAAAILGLIFTSLMGTAMENSWKSIDIVAGEADAEGTMNKIISSYIKEMNNDPENALGNIMGTGYDFGEHVTMKYISFDTNGNEVDPGYATNTVKVTVDAPGKDFITIITKSRKTADPIVAY